MTDFNVCYMDFRSCMILAHAGIDEHALHATIDIPKLRKDDKAKSLLGVVYLARYDPTRTPSRTVCDARWISSIRSFSTNSRWSINIEINHSRKFTLVEPRLRTI